MTPRDIKAADTEEDSHMIRAALFAIIAHMAIAHEASAKVNEPIQPIVRKNVESPAKVVLGKSLFFDPRLSKSGSISCNSCHNLATGGVDNLPSSIGHKWNVGPINSPTVLNSSYGLAQFWDGRAKDLVEQAGGPMANPGEMASTHELAVSVLRSIPGYAPLFKAGFGTSEVTIQRVQQAIAAFEETLVTPDSRFDKWLTGDDKALTAQEKEGYRRFKERGCAACHNGPAVGGTSFQKMGLVRPYASKSPALGRIAVTGTESDRYVFKVPTLRNVELTYPYFHDGSVWTLEEAISVMARHQLGLDMAKAEIDDIAAFLRTLTGKQPELVLPRLPPSGPDTPRPDAN